MMTSPSRYSICESLKLGQRQRLNGFRPVFQRSSTQPQGHDLQVHSLLLCGDEVALRRLLEEHRILDARVLHDQGDIVQIPFMGSSSDERGIARLGDAGPTALHFCLAMLTKQTVIRYIWNHSFIQTSSFETPFSVALISSATADRPAAMWKVEYDGLNRFQDKDQDEKSTATLTEHFERAETQFERRELWSVGSDGSGRSPSVQAMRICDIPRERRVGANASVNHALHGAPAVAHGQEAVVVGGGSLVNHGSGDCAGQAHVRGRPLQFAADQRDLLASSLESDDLELKFQTRVNTDKQNQVDVIVSSGSTRGGSDQLLRQWERAYFCFDFAAADSNWADAVSGMILDAIQEDTLFKLKPRGGGDHNSVVVLTSDYFRRFLIRVRMNTDNFDERPLVNPREEKRRSASRMFKYGRMLTMSYEIPLLPAAISTRHYFGFGFDKVFRSYSHFCDLMVGKKRVDTSIDGVQQTAANLMVINCEARDIDRLYGCTFGGDNPGAFETKRDEIHVIEDAIAFTRCFNGTLEILVCPNSPHEISIFYAGKRYPMTLEQVREAALSFCEAGVGTVANGLEVVCVNKYLDGGISYCVLVESEFDEDINEFKVVYGHDLFP